MRWLSLLTARRCSLSGGPAIGLALWSVAERREIRRLSRIQEGTRRPLCRLFLVSTAFSPDGKERIAVEREGVCIRDVISGKERALGCAVQYRLLYTPLSHLMAASWPPARRAPAVGRKRNTANHVWELASGQEVATLELPEDGEGTSHMAYSPDGRFLVACCNPSTRNPGDQMIRIWDVASGQEVRQFTGHLAPAWSAAFTADGRSIVSGSADGTALVWDVSDLANQPKAEPLAADALKDRWDELSSPDARVAYRAMWALSVPSAVPFLRDRLSAAPASAHQGTAVTEGPAGPPEVLRVLRAIAALERVGTPEARGVLEPLAHGDPSALQTKEARATLARFKIRTN